MSRFTLQDERGFNQVFAPVGSTPLRMRRRGDWFVTQIARFGAQRVLEIGSGTGETAAYLATHSNAEIVAVDISEAFVAEARARHSAPNLRYELFDLLGDKPMAFGRFDMVCGNGILHHLVQRLPDVLSALHDLTNPGGGLAFVEPNFLNPYCAFIFGTKIGRRFARLEPDEMAFTPGELRRALPAAGWRNVDVATRDFLLPGLPEVLVKPSLAIEPALEATAATRWLAQSHFMTARA
ncbi:class I SAM-dependent methyltransferase [Bosea sp. 685]|uniref:class I SAM-dependent methyltransferase n=1 Tax=Bosea sp. 685 TaxID=3080057 RepID=UPI0028934B94|nr:class I SAM-dependent methyltransferase [Bosea sp. 685]WNJ90030.1 class I SAM-dependent methyltransferase [Bosea sp. 685]